MAEDAAAPAQLSDRKTRSIGEVINGLRPEFPDLTVSKVRFLEAQGLIDPSRSPSGYRMFTEDDVDRVVGAYKASLTDMREEGIL